MGSKLSGDIGKVRQGLFRDMKMILALQVPIVDPAEAKTIDLSGTTDTEVNEIFHCHTDQKKMLDTAILACGEAAQVLLSLFECQHCGRCCEGSIFREPVVPLIPGEPRRIADFLGWSAKRLRQFCTHRNGILYLKLPCPFYIEHACSIYEVRPMGCRLYPIQGIVRMKRNGQILPPTFTLDIDCPGGNELALKVVKLGKEKVLQKV